jgi:LysM repeat protein
MVFLGGLLMQGCKREEMPETADLVLPPFEESTNYAGLPMMIDTNEPPIIAATNGAPTPFPEELQLGSNTLPRLPDELTATNPPPIVPEPELQPGPESPDMVDYTVQRGDYFYSIARKFDISAADIARANPGVDSTRLQIGQVLKIPTSRAVQPSVPVPGETGGTGLYTVKSGDTLTRIARQYGTTVPALKEMNGLVTDRILINQVLKVPAPSGEGTPGN